MLGAESGLNPFSRRYATWPDVSGGLSHLTIQTAAGYGIGDGSNTAENIEAVMEILCDRQRAIDLGGQHLAAAYRAVTDHLGSSTDLEALAYYNAGTYSFHTAYWEDPATRPNVDNYQGWLDRADEILREQGLEGT